MAPGCCRSRGSGWVPSPLLSVFIKSGCRRTAAGLFCCQPAPASHHGTPRPAAPPLTDTENLTEQKTGELRGFRGPRRPPEPPPTYLMCCEWTLTHTQGSAVNHDGTATDLNLELSQIQQSVTAVVRGLRQWGRCRHVPIEPITFSTRETMSRTRIWGRFTESALMFKLWQGVCPERGRARGLLGCWAFLQQYFLLAYRIYLP